MSIEHLRKLVLMKNKLKEKEFQTIKESPPRVEKLSKDDILYKKTLQLKGELNQTSKNVMGVTKINPLKGPSKQMVEDYINKQNQPVIIDGIKYRYHPIIKPIKSPDIAELQVEEQNALLTLEEAKEGRTKILNTIDLIIENNERIAENIKETEIFKLEIENLRQKITDGEELEPLEIEKITKVYNSIKDRDPTKFFNEVRGSGRKKGKKKVEKKEEGKEEEQILPGFVGEEGEEEEEEKKELTEEQKSNIETLERRMEKKEIRREKSLERTQQLKEELKELINRDQRLLTYCNEIITKLRDVNFYANEKLRENDRMLEQMKRALEGYDAEEEEYKHQYLNAKNKKELEENNYKRLFAEYEQTIKNLNSSKIISKQPNETDEEYEQRLQELGDEPLYDEQTEKRAELYNLQIFKNNLRELTNDETKIEEVYNYFNTLGSGNIYNFNKIFPLFKTTFIKLYGTNNRAIKTSDIINYIKSFLDNENLPIYNEQAIIPFSFSNLTTDVIPFPEKDALRLERQYGPQIVEKEPQIVEFEEPKENIPEKLQKELEKSKNIKEKFKIISILIQEPDIGYYSVIKEGQFLFNLASYKRRDGKENIYYSTDPNGTPGTWRSMSGQTNNPNNRATNVLKNLLGEQAIDFIEGIGAEELKTKGGYNDSTIITSLKNIIKFKYPEGQNEISEGDKNSLIYGFGIKKRNKPKEEYIKFGKIFINPDKLKFKNILSVQNSKRLKIAGLKNKNVSDDLANVILKISNGEEPKIKDINILNEDEKLLLDNILYLANLNKTIGTGLNPIEKYKHKLDIIVGQITAGNNNQMIKKDLYEILFKLVHLGAIGEREARNYYKEITQNYF